MSEVCRRREVRGQSEETSSQSDACPAIFATEYKRSLEESGEGGTAGQEKWSWEAEDSPEKMCGRWMCSDCYLRFDRYNVQVQ